MTALGAMRSLARAGVETYVTGSRSDVDTKSRYFRPLKTSKNGRIIAPWDAPDGYEQLASLPFDKAVLIPCSDVAALWASKLPDELRDRFVQSNATAAVQTQLQDKRTFAKLCTELNVPHPPHYIVESKSDLDNVPIEELQNCFFKPFNSRHFVNKYGTKGLRFNTRAEAERLWHEVSQTGIAVFIQEYVPGGGDQHYFIDCFRDRDGEIRACFPRRRRRIYPIDFGNSSYCHTVPVSEVVPAWESLKRIVEHVDYRGIFSGEFKFDHRDGTYRIIEINTRVWVYVEFASSRGVNVCLQAYHDALGTDVPTHTYSGNAAGCVDLYRDFCCVRETPAPERPKIGTVLGQWWSAKKTVFAWDDLRPAMHWGAQHIASRWRT